MSLKSRAYRSGRVKFVFSAVLGSDLDEFVAQYRPGKRHVRKASWSEENAEGRWRLYEYDEMVFYTCDSMKKALRLIKKSRVDRWSWWEIQSQELNSLEWPQHVGFYGARAGALPKPPYDKCVALFKKARSKS